MAKDNDPDIFERLSGRLTVFYRMAATTYCSLMILATIYCGYPNAPNPGVTESGKGGSDAGEIEAAGIGGEAEGGPVVPLAARIAGILY